MKTLSKVIIEEKVWRKFMHMVDLAPGEVSGLGAVEMKNGIPHVTDVFLCKQKNSGATTDLDADDVCRLMFEHRDKDLRWWVHSHADMAVFWSGTDRATIKELGGQGWILATVVNKKRECKSAFFSTATISTPLSPEPLAFEIFEEDIATTIAYEVPADLKANWDSEYEKCCKTESQASFLDDWDKRRASPYWSLYCRVKCCHDWDTFLTHHKDEIETIDKMIASPKKTADDFFSENPGEAAAEIIRNDSAAIPGVGYQEVKEEVMALIGDGLTLDGIRNTVEYLFGNEWDWVVRNLWMTHGLREVRDA